MSVDPRTVIRETDTEEWSCFSDPYIWYHKGEEVTIETVREFTEEGVDSVFQEWCERNFPPTEYTNPAYMFGGIRLKVRGIPYYECDVLRIEWIGGRVFLHHTVRGDERSDLGGLSYHLSKTMTEADGYSEFDQLLDDVGIEVRE